jgi:hypothetical protein
MNNTVSPVKITGIINQYKYTIATLVSDMREYEEMVASYCKAGFTADICEYIYIDNIGENSFEAYEGLNLFLQLAKGEFIIFTHQDILLNFDTIDVLQQRMDEITKLDPNWAILSNAGGIENDFYHRIAAHVVYADGFDQIVNTMPKKVCSVDENFIVVKKSANLSLSRDLAGFHLYGTDLCLVAELLGYSAYAIDFKLTHKSYGNPDGSYYIILEKLVEKYVRFMRSRTIMNTITDFRLSTSAVNTFFFSGKIVKKVRRKAAKYKFKYAKKQQGNN